MVFCCGVCEIALTIMCHSAEQQYFEVEKRLAQSQERLVNQTQECQTLRQELNKLSKYVVFK